MASCSTIVRQNSASYRDREEHVSRNSIESRSACVHCKHRRVKCDRLLPCMNCIKRSQRCQYPRNRNDNDDYDTAYSESPTRSMQQWSRDMFLMHHYSTHTAPEFLKSDPVMERLWTKDIPPLALKHPALWHGLLSLSALHLAISLPSDENGWTRSALIHQNKAIKFFRSSLLDLNMTSIHPTMALSVILAVWSMAYSWAGEISRQKKIDDYIEPLVHISGVFGMLQIGREWLHSGPLRPFAPTKPSACLQFEAQTILKPHIQQQFDLLEGAIQTTETDKSTKSCLLRALQHLARIYCVLDKPECSQTNHQNLGHIWRFAAVVDKDYITSLRSSNDLALIIFGHFVILIAGYDKQWYLSGYAAGALAAVRETVSTHWSTYLDWPEERLKNRDLVA